MAFTRKTPGPHQPHDAPDRSGTLLGEAARARIAAAVSSVSVPPISEAPRYEAASQVVRVLEHARGLAQAEYDLLQIEAAHASIAANEITNSPRRQQEKQRADRLRQRLAQATPTAAPQPVGDVPPAVKVGLEVASGGTITKPANRQKRLTELRDKLEILDAALHEQNGVVARVQEELSYQVCVELREAHNELLRQQLHAAQSLAAVTDVERAFRAAILHAGYTIRADIIVVPAVRAPLMLGSEQDLGSEVSTWAQILKNNGVV
jgi:hypothetical protein